MYLYPLFSTELVISTANDELLDIREETAPKNKKKDKDAASSAAKKTEQSKASATATESTENGEAAKDSEAAAEKPATEEGAADAKMEEDVPEDEVVKDEESEDCILDYKPGDEIAPEIDNKLPRYKKNRALGVSLIGKLECHECRICFKYFDNEATGEIHARTHSHYRAFIRFLNEKAQEVRIAQKRAAVALEEAEAAKKQKLAAEEKKSENGDADKKDSELYDPSEATGEGTDTEQ